MPVMLIRSHRFRSYRRKGLLLTVTLLTALLVLALREIVVLQKLRAQATSSALPVDLPHLWDAAANVSQPPRVSSAPFASAAGSALPDYCVQGSEADFWRQKYSKQNLEMSRGYTGSGYRLKRVVEKAAEGKAVTMAVIGGSVSSGHGTRPNETYFERILQHWNTSFFPNPRNIVVNGARPASGSDYFSLCFADHIPQDSDIVFVELSINEFRDVSAAIMFETLLRELLDLPSQPAVILASVFALAFTEGLSLGGDIHLGVAQYYDVPVISLRNPLLPMLLENPELERELFEWNGLLDRRHINSLGHEMLADFVTSWMRDQICEIHDAQAMRDNPQTSINSSRTEAQPGWWKSSTGLDKVPRLRMTQPWDYDTVNPVIRPSCRSTTSKQRLEPLVSSGWDFEVATFEKMYWSSNVPGSVISFRVSVGLGTVGIFYLRSPKHSLGNAACWIDDDERTKRQVQGWWGIQASITQYLELASDIPPGDHILHCEILSQTADPGGGNAFKIIGIASV